MCSFASNRADARPSHEGYHHPGRERTRMPRSFRTGPFDRRGGVEWSVGELTTRDAPGDDNAPPDDEPARGRDAGSGGIAGPVRWSACRSIWGRARPQKAVGPGTSGSLKRPDFRVYITPARKFRMLLHINPTRQRGKRTGSLARASGWYMTFFAAGVIARLPGGLSEQTAIDGRNFCDGKRRRG